LAPVGRSGIRSLSAAADVVAHREFGKVQVRSHPRALRAVEVYPRQMPYKLWVTGGGLGRLLQPASAFQHMRQDPVTFECPGKRLGERPATGTVGVET
jgi:hypothetical protein